MSTRQEDARVAGRVFFVGLAAGSPDYLTLSGQRVLAEAQLVVVGADVKETLAQPELSFRPEVKVIEILDDPDVAHALTQVKEASRAGELIAWLSPSQSIAQETICGHSVAELALSLVQDGVPVGVVPYSINDGENPENILSQGCPLADWRVLVPFTRRVSSPLLRRLTIYGAEIVTVPTLAIEPPRNTNQFERAVHGLVEGCYQWVIFTSVHAVRAIIEYVVGYGLDARCFAGIRVGVTDEQAEEELRSWGIVPDFIPVERTGLGLAADFPIYDSMLDPLDGVLVPKADTATEPMTEGLTKLGWKVDEVTVFRAVRAPSPSAEIREAIKQGDFDAVLFSSSTAVANLIGIAGKPHASTLIGAIGQATAQACQEHGLEVAFIPEHADPRCLADSLAACVEVRRNRLIALGKEPLRPSQCRRRRRVKK